MLDAAIDQFRAASKAVELSVLAVKGSGDDGIAATTMKALAELLNNNPDGPNVQAFLQRQRPSQVLERKQAADGTGDVACMRCCCWYPWSWWAEERCRCRDSFAKGRTREMTKEGR